MPFSESFLRELDARSPIEEIASSYVNLKRRGKNLVGLCPFHNEKTPSFNLYPENNSYYCFGCGKGGGVFQFVMDAENLAFQDAVRWLAQRAGMEVPEEQADDSMARLRTRVLEINREAGRFYYRMLSTPAGKAGLEYFQRRGLDAKTIRRFGLGYSPDSGFALTNHLQKMGYTPAELQASDMVRLSQKGNLYDRYRGRVMFPIFDLRGNVVAFGGRILTDEKPKYINTSDTPVYHKSSGLFAMNFAKDAVPRGGEDRQLILAEGYMDVIAMHRAGFQNTVASLGTSLTEEQARILRRYAEEVIICYDADDAGQNAVRRAIPILKNAGLQVRVAVVPGGKDPDEFLRTHPDDGALRLKRVFEQSGNDTEYRLEKIKAKYDLTTPDGKSRYLREAAEQLLVRLAPMERDIYAGRLSQETDVSRQYILDTANRAAAQRARKEKKEMLRAQSQLTTDRPSMNPQRKENLQAALAEESVISYLYLHPDKREQLLQRIPPERFVTDWNKRVYRFLADKAEFGELNFAAFSQELTREEAAELTRIFAEHRAVPPTWNDVEEYAKILDRLQGFANPQTIANASMQEINQYFEELRRQKLPQQNETEQGMRKEW